MEKYALIVLPMVICFAALMVPLLLWRWDRKRRNVRPPVSEKMLRPPGESLRLKVRELDERIDYYFMMCLVTGALLGICIFSLPVQLKRMPPVVAILILCIMVSPCVAYYSIRAFRTLKERSNYQLGFDGERFVGELLNQLMLEDCRVFHDFPADKKWNIDHIVVAPAGVFVIETKTLRKQDAPPGKRDNTIVFDRRRLEFPTEFIEVENTTDMHGAFLKFVTLDAFYSTFRVVSPAARKQEFASKLAHLSFSTVAGRTRFTSYDLVSQMHSKESEIAALQQAWAAS